MRAVRPALKVLGYLILAFLLTASIGSVLIGHPFLLEVEQTNSMYPLLQHGDVAFVLPLPASDAKIGSIILFHPKRGPLASVPFVVHRIVGGGPEQGYLTKGDHNAETDQQAGATTRVPPAWIEGIVPTLNGQPLRVPLIGDLALWAGSQMSHLYLVPAAGAVALLALSLVERRPVQAQHQRRSRQEVLVLALLSTALILAVLTAALVLATSEQEVAPYMVANRAGVLNGSAVGVLTPGTVVRVPAANLYNTGFFPLAVAVVSTDPNAAMTPSSFWLPPKGSRVVRLRLRASGMGMHQAKIWIGLFPPLLPPGALVLLERRSYWLAVVCVSLMPALPFLAYLVLAPRMRRSALRLGRRAVRPLTRLLANS